MASIRRKSPIARRRRLEDEGEDEASRPFVDVEEDSASEASAASAMATPADSAVNGRTDADIMLNGLSLAEQNGAVEEIQYEDMKSDLEASTLVEPPPTVRSTAQVDQQPETMGDRRNNKDHEDYKKRKEADPAFVPNRGAFFMHDTRHAGPGAHRPLGRGRGRGRAGFGGGYQSMHQTSHPAEPTDSQWSHDLHETVAEAGSRHMQVNTSQNAYGRVPQASKSVPIDRSLSCTKSTGKTVTIRFCFPSREPIAFAGVPVKEYTKLPDHRPPLRRDKPVRISLPDYPPRYLFPVIERSFIFIPRAMRPNQQGYNSRGRQRNTLGSHGGYSRRTSVFGGSMYGSAYTPSALSRRSSLAHEVTRENIVSPTGSVVSRPAFPIDNSGPPLVRFPPSAQSAQQQPAGIGAGQEGGAPSASMENLPRPQTYPLPQRPIAESQPKQLTMHQPRPQKSVSVADIETPASLSFNPPNVQQQPFHQQVPAQMNSNGYNDGKARGSYLPQGTTGTPLSQIPERAIHAQPFQPNPYQDHQAYYQPQYQVMPPQPGYYYPYTSAMAPSVPAPAFMPPHQQSYAQPAAPPPDSSTAQQQNLVAQEVNGTVFYYDASQIPAVASYPPQYPPLPAYTQPMIGMGGMMTPSPDGFYFGQPSQGVVYYPQ